MQQFELLKSIEFHDPDPYAQPLFVDANSRVLRFMLKPGQSIEEHAAPNSPFTAIIIKGQGYFAGPDGKEKKFGPNTLLFFEAGEKHTVRAGDEELIFIGFLQGAPGARAEHTGGELGQE